GLTRQVLPFLDAHAGLAGCAPSGDFGRHRATCCDARLRARVGVSVFFQPRPLVSALLCIFGLPLRLLFELRESLCESRRPFRLSAALRFGKPLEQRLNPPPDGRRHAVGARSDIRRLVPVAAAGDAGTVAPGLLPALLLAPVVV